MENEMARLRRRFGELEEELRQVRALMVPDVNSAAAARLNLEPQEYGVLERLRRAYPGCATLERLSVGLSARADNPGAVAKMRIFTLRRKLAAHGVVIKSAKGAGYYLDAGGKARLDALVAAAERGSIDGD